MPSMKLCYIDHIQIINDQHQLRSIHVVRHLNIPISPPHLSIVCLSLYRWMCQRLFHVSSFNLHAKPRHRQKNLFMRQDAVHWYQVTSWQLTCGIDDVFQIHDLIFDSSQYSRLDQRFPRQISNFSRKPYLFLISDHRLQIRSKYITEIRPSRMVPLI